MDKKLVMVVVAPDRPGLVGRFSNLVRENGGSWMDSRMARLGGQFAGIVQITVPPAGEGTLRKAFESLTAEGITISLHEGTEFDPSIDSARRRAHLELVGSDRPGIVERVSACLAEHAVNVEELETEVSVAPMSAETLFRARARLALLDDQKLANLRDSLERIGADLLVDIQFSED